MGLLPVPLCGKKTLNRILSECLALKGGKRLERLMLLLCDVDGQSAHGLGFIGEWLTENNYHKCEFVGFTNAQNDHNLRPEPGMATSFRYPIIDNQPQIAFGLSLDLFPPMLKALAVNNNNHFQPALFTTLPSQGAVRLCGWGILRPSAPEA